MSVASIKSIILVCVCVSVWWPACLNLNIQELSFVPDGAVMNIPYSSNAGETGEFQSQFIKQKTSEYRKIMKNNEDLPTEDRNT